MKQVINDRVSIVFSHSKTRDEDVAARELAASLNKEGVSTGQKMQIKDGLGNPSIMENLLWFVTHPETVSAAKDVFVGPALIIVGYWLKGSDNRSLRVECDDYKVEVNNIDELKEAIRLLPPPSVKEILEDGDMFLNGEVVSKDDVDTYAISSKTRPRTKKGSRMEQDIPHGHGLSFKKGTSDGLLNGTDYSGDLPNGHDESYARGVQEGIALRAAVAARVRPEVLG